MFPKSQINNTLLNEKGVSSVNHPVYSQLVFGSLRMSYSSLIKGILYIFSNK